MTPGFFDKEGYEEPLSHYHKRQLIIWTAVVLIGIIIVTVALLYWVFCYKKDERALKKRQYEKIHAD